MGGTGRKVTTSGYEPHDTEKPQGITIHIQENKDDSHIFVVFQNLRFLTKTFCFYIEWQLLFKKFNVFSIAISDVTTGSRARNLTGRKLLEGQAPQHS